MQSKKDMMLEQVVRVGIGFVTNYPINCVLLAAFGLQSKHGSSTGLVSLYITLAFTVWAIIRGYLVRIWFEKRTHKARKVIEKPQLVKGYQGNSPVRHMDFNSDGFALD